MTCHDCGMTIGWDCECDEEYNALVEGAAARGVQEEQDNG